MSPLGNWSDISTWNGGAGPVPGPDDAVVIGLNTTVIVDTLAAQASTTTVNGTLLFSRSVSSALTLTRGNITVNSGGTLDMGTAASPINAPGVTATLVLALGATPAQYGLTVNNGGAMTVWGADKSPAALVQSGDVLVNATQFQVTAAGGQGWAVGDTIVVGQTERASFNQSEERVITSTTSADPMTIGLDYPLNYFHSASSGVHVANLTRNVLVRSSGTDTSAAGNAAYIRNLSLTAANFQLVQGEFAYIGADANPTFFAHQDGLTFDDDAKGSVSSCTVRGGHIGIYVYSNSGNTFSNNILYDSDRFGVLVDQADGHSFLSNYFIANRESGLSLLQPSSRNITVSSNVAFSNVASPWNSSAGYGFAAFSSRSLSFTNNLSFANGTFGFLLQNGAVDATLTGNRVYNNFLDGMHVIGSGTGGHVIASNAVASNGRTGIYLRSGTFRNLISANDVSRSVTGIEVELFSPTMAGNFVVANLVHDNTGNGIRFIDADGNVAAGNVSYANGPSNFGAGITMSGSSQGNLTLSNTLYANATGLVAAGANTSVEDRLGYDAAGNPATNVSANLQAGGFGSANVLKRCRVNQSGSWFANNIGNTNSFLLSYGQEFATGTVRLFGDYVAGGAFVLDHAQNLYASSATAPVLIRGTGHGASVVSTNDANAVTQVITLLYDGANWQVQGSVTGLGMDSFPGAVSGRAIPSSNPQFTLDFTPGGSPQTGDRLMFALTASSRDAGQPKTLLFDAVLAGFNGGKSRLTVPPSASLTLRGIPGTPAIMDRRLGFPNYYTLVASGAVTLQDAEVRNADSGGLQLTGSPAVTIASTVFDEMGQTSTVGAYITAQDLASAAAFTGVTFGNSRSTATFSAAHNVRVAGSDASLSWTFSGWGGAMADYPYESDPNGKVRWLDGSPPPAVSNLVAAPTSNYGEMLLTWTAPANDAAGSRALWPGTFLIFYSTNPADTASAVPGQAQVPISTHAVAGGGQSHLLQGLLLDQPYHVKLWTRDETPNTSGASNTATASAGHPTPQAPLNLDATLPSTNTVRLTWSPPASPTGAYLAGYRVEYSSVSPSSLVPLVTLSSTTFSYDHPNLDYNTVYYYRILTEDAGGALSAPSGTVSELTGDVAAPTVVAALPNAVGPSVAAWGQAIDLTFSKPMQAGTVTGAVTLTRLRDNLGVALSSAAAVAVSGGPGQMVFTVTPLALLAANSLYELAVATTATDAQGKALASSTTLRFTTLMDRTVRNVVTEGLQGMTVDVPAQALALDGYLAGQSLPASQVDAATRKLVSASGDALRRPVGGGIVDLDALDGQSAPQPAFATPVTVTFSFDDLLPRDGDVDGTSPPAKVKSLAVYWLNEQYDLWVRLPSRVDAAAGTVSAETSHFSTFALMTQSDTDLSEAYAFPSPWTARSGRSTVTFTGLGQGATIRIYTIEGALVRELPVPTGAATLDWDLRNADGAPVATGLYAFEVSNAKERKTGRLGVVR